MNFVIRRRSTGKIVESGFTKRESGKNNRDKLNIAFYGLGKVPEHNREYYIARSHTHRFGPSK